MDQVISEFLQSNQINPILLAPVLLVFVGALLVFIFGFKKPVEPPFKKLLASGSVSKRVGGSGGNTGGGGGKQKNKDKSSKSSAQNGNVSGGVSGGTTVGAATPTSSKITDGNKKLSASTKIEENKNKQKSSGLAGGSVGTPSKKKDEKDEKSLKKSQQQQQANQQSLTSKKSASAAKEKKNGNNKAINKTNTVIVNDFANTINNDNEGEWKTVLSKTDKKKKAEEAVAAGTGAIQQSNDNRNKKIEKEKKKDSTTSGQSKKESKNQKETKNHENKSKRDVNAVELKKDEIPIQNDNIKEIEKEKEPEIVEQQQQLKDENPIDEDINHHKEQQQKKKNDENLTKPEVTFEENGHNGQILEDILKEVDVPSTIKTENLNELTSTKNVTVEVLNVAGAGNIVFDELGDAWTEMKAPKKQKRKIRKE